MNKSNYLKIIPLSVSLLMSSAHAADTTNLTDLTNGDPFFYTSNVDIKEDNKEKALLGVGRPNKTHSQIPHLPFYTGYMSTNSTYRFVNVAEQVFTMIGEGKHGLWRVQENGMVREYLKKGAKGLAKDANVLDDKNLDLIRESYSSYIPEESWSGYKYPDEQLTKDGQLNYIDLPITHKKYQAKYQKHEAVDLPNWYCTMSENDYPYAKNAMNFAFAQPGANQVGPLGKRAGLDIKENYTNVLRLNHFPDARSWVNVGQQGEDKLHVNWQSVDTKKTDVEYYLVERPFFNKPYLFVTAVFANKDNNDFSYVRPDGSYYDSIKKNATLKTVVTKSPRFHLENGELKEAVGLPIFGVHHQNRAAFGGGGACPLKGGDWARYPSPLSGSGWPTNYEEVTPLCDSVLVDIKFFANLDGKRWNNPDKYLANAGVGKKEVEYKVQPGRYGEFTDQYNVSKGEKNTEATNVPASLNITFPSINPPVTYVQPKTVDLDRRMVPSKESMCRPIMNTANKE